MFKRSGIWYCHVRIDGRRVQKSLGTPIAKVAKAIEAKLKTEIIEAKYLEKLPGEKKTMVEMLDRFIQEHGRKVSIGQVRSYGSSRKPLEKFFGMTPLSKIRPKRIAEYKQHRLTEGKKPATVNREIACLSKAFKIAVREWEWLRESPTTLVSREREDNKVIRWLSEDEEPLLYQASPDWLKPLVVFAIHTGMRQGEILELKWKLVNLFRREINILKSKNSEPRTIPMSKRLFELLKERSKVRSIGSLFVFFCI